MTIKALHISHTDIDGDNRILKEMATLTRAGIVKTVGVGISDHSKYTGDIRSVRNYSRSLSIGPAPIRKFGKMLMLFLVYIRLAVSAVRINAKIVHSHDWFVLPIAVLHKAVWSSKVIYDAHELESDTNTKSRLRKRSAYWVEKLFLRYVDAFITVSHSILDWYKDQFGEIHPSAVVLNTPKIGSDETRDSSVSAGSILRDQLDIPRNKSLGVYLGGLEVGRGLDVIISALAQEQGSTHFLFIGYGSRESELRKRATEIGCRNVTFVGKLPHDKVVDYICGCDYGMCLIEPVSLSDIYALPNKLFEYVSAGLYVYGSDLPEIKAFLENTGRGEVVALDPDSVRSAIAAKRFKTAPKLDFESIRAFTWDKQESSLISLYEDVLAK